MNILIWKEWRENRLSAVFASGLMLVFYFGAQVMARANASYNHGNISYNDLLSLLFWAWGFAALLCGAATVAPEIGNNTLQFLSVLPMSRQKIWFIKLLVGLGLLALCMGSSAVIFWLVSQVTHNISNKLALDAIKDDVTTMLLMILPIFTVSMLVSTLIDRTFNAMIISLVVGIGWAAGLSTLWTAIGFKDATGQFALTVLNILTVPLFLSMSYQVFVKGESLKTQKRFWTLAESFFQPVVVIGIALLIAYFWIVS